MCSNPNSNRNTFRPTARYTRELYVQYIIIIVCSNLTTTHLYLFVLANKPIPTDQIFIYFYRRSPQHLLHQRERLRENS